MIKSELKKLDKDLRKSTRNKSLIQVSDNLFYNFNHLVLFSVKKLVPTTIEDLQSDLVTKITNSNPVMLILLLIQLITIFLG